jgi:hypothetical protein
MKNAICSRPTTTKITDRWKNENGVIVIGPKNNEKVTITERSIVSGEEVVRLQEYKLPQNGWWPADCFIDI